MLPLRFQWYAVVSVVSLSIAGCQQIENIPHPVAPNTERCPNDAYVGPGGVLVHEGSDSSLVPLAGKIADIPEYHDCQRLLRPGKVYGPLVGIWARDELASVPLDNYRRGVAVAELLNFSTVGYPQLGIGPGYNCLYLQGDTSNWRAFMVQLDTRSRCPDEPRAGEYRIIPLQVRVQPETKGQAPPAARWDLDPRTDIQYMGVWCPSGWCEIGVRGFQPSAEHGGSQEMRVKGWYDEQYLSVFDSVSGTLRPTSIRGRTVPAPRLDTLTLQHFGCRNCNAAPNGGWIYMASTFIEKDSANYYQRKLNLMPNAENRVYIRHNLDSNVWEARIVNASSTRMAQMLRVDHRNVRVPATSRWHFVPRDETVWVRCSDGCCDVSRAM